MPVVEPKAKETTTSVVKKEPKEVRMCPQGEKKMNLMSLIESNYAI